jgi:hypothetical protein
VKRHPSDGSRRAVVHVPVNPGAVDLSDVVGEKIGDVLVGFPVDGHAEGVAVAVGELFLQFRSLKPVVAEPVEIRELLVRQLVDLAVGGSREAEADEVGQIQCRQGECGAVAGDPVGDRHRRAIAPVGAEVIAVVDVGVVEVPPRSHLDLHAIDQFALGNDVMNHGDVGDLAKGAGKVARLVFVSRNRFRDDEDLLAPERRGGPDEKFHLRHLLVLGERGRLKFDQGPAARRVHPHSVGRGNGFGRCGRQRRADTKGSCALQQCAAINEASPAVAFSRLGHRSPLFLEVKPLVI